MKCWLGCILALAGLASVDAGFRCGLLNSVPFLGATNDRACRASCWVAGQSTGYCDSEGECNCSEEPLNLSEKVRKLLGDLTVAEYVKLKIAEFKDEVDSWEVAQSIKEMTPSRCQVDEDGSFCAGTCHSIGRVTGTCNADNTDCECSDDTVSPKQYATCLDTGICSIYCVRKGFARGKCMGATGWDCKCVTLKAGADEEFVDLELEDGKDA